MTAEEIAEEQIKKWDSLLYPQMYPVALVKDFIRKACLAGLEKGIPQWHDLRKDPKDLPEQFTLVFGYFNIVDGTPWNSNYVACQYGNGNWYDDCMTYIEQDREPVAWCEILKFEEVVE